MKNLLIRLLILLRIKKPAQKPSVTIQGGGGTGPRQ